jgi:hypothetical protein
MSIKSFFVKVGEEVETLFKHAAAVETKIQQAVLYVAPFAVELIDLVDPAVAPVAAPIIKAIEGGLASLSVVSKGVTIVPGSSESQIALAAINSVNTNIASLLATAQVKDPATITKATELSNLITGELDAVANGLTTATPPPAATSTVPPAPTPAATA